MHDEFRTSVARQGIGEEAYLKATGQTEADLHAEFRPRAEQRTKVLLVLSKIAEAEGIDVPDAEIEAQIELARQRYQDQKTVRYFESERGRNFIRSTLRRTKVVEALVDRWLAAHPEHPACRTSRTTRRRRSTARRPRRTPRSARPTRAPSPTPSRGTTTITTTMTTITTMTTAMPWARARSRRLPRPARSAASARRRPTDVAGPNAGETDDARPDGHRIHESWRARLRHLLAAPARADHLPR